MHNVLHDFWYHMPIRAKLSEDSSPAHTMNYLRESKYILKLTFLIQEMGQHYVQNMSVRLNMTDLKVLALLLLYNGLFLSHAHIMSSNNL